MLQCARTTKLLWFQQRPLRTVSKRFGLKFSSSPGSKVLVSADEEYDDFLPWLERLAGTEISKVLSIGKSGFGRTLFASKNIHTGDCILKVPYNVQITPDNLPSSIKTSLTSKVGNSGKLAVAILLEKKKGQDSRWAPYVSLLPQLAEMHCTIFWSEDELEMIHCSPVHKETSTHKAKIEREFLVVQQVLKQHFPKVLGSITLKDFMHAYALVSRAWGNSKNVSLIPFADFMNHDWVSESILSSDDEKQLSEVSAGRDYSPGEEVLIRYGKFSNAILLMAFGFTLPYNFHDQVQILMHVPNHDPLCKMKLELLQSHSTRRVKDVNDLESSSAYFTIKEVRSAKGKGKGLPQSLRAFARVLSCTSSEELSDLATEAAQKDDRLARYPLKDSSKEVRAHQLLLSHITELIDEHNACIESLESFNSPPVSERFELRRQMARDLLIGELRVLKSAAAWLTNYCTTLLTTVHHP